MSNDTKSIHEADVRQIVSLLADITEMVGGHVQKKTALLEGLCELIGAEKWVWLLRIEDPEKGEPRFAGYLQGGFTTKQFLHLSDVAAHPQVPEIDAPMRGVLKRKKCHVTMRVEDFDKRKLWHGDEISKLAKLADVGTFLSSSRPISDVAYSNIALYRSFGNPSFSERERRIAHIILSEVTWLHNLGWPKKHYVESLPSLPKSHMKLLFLLLQGYSRKEIADFMKLSAHTINSYIKVIYKHFNVSSHPMLMQRFIYGDDYDDFLS